MVPRAAPAPLLSSSDLLQREEVDVTVRAGFRRSAGSRHGVVGLRKALATVAVPFATVVNRQCISASRGGSEKAQHGDETRQAPTQGFP